MNSSLIKVCKISVLRQWDGWAASPDNECVGKRQVLCFLLSERNKRQRAGENIMNPEEIRNGIMAENAEINGAISNGHQLLGVNKNILWVESNWVL